jgi:tetratricopeptide (TPR) repeat protein
VSEPGVESGEAKSQPASPRSRFPPTARSNALTGLLVPGLLLAISCASVPQKPVGPGDQFPLDPREELMGPFSEETLRGCAALAEGNASAAEAAFSAAISRRGQRLPAEIGRIEAVVLQGRAAETLPACEQLLGSGDPTLPLLVACGEAHFRSGNAIGGLALYLRALARSRDRPGLERRAEDLRLAARDQWLARARASAEAKQWARSRAAIAEAITLSPESSALRVAFAEIELKAGEKAAALTRYREAVEMEPRNAAVLEKTAALALDLKEYALAVSVFERLARMDPRFAPKAADARLAFRVANWPAAEREAARAAKLTRADAAEILWWMVPEVREARVVSGAIASDAVSRRDSRAVTRAAALGLLEVDQETHRVNPDAHLSVPAAAKLLVRLFAILKPPSGDVPCLQKPVPAFLSNADAVRLAQGCGLMNEREGPSVSGPAFLRALDRERSLVEGGGAR